MRAALLAAQGQPLEIVDDIVIRDPRPGEVKVRVRHCGICHSDLTIADGAFPTGLPLVLGHEAAGVVEEVGEGVTTHAPGDQVVLTPCPPCGSCYWCIRGEWSLCVNSTGLLTNTFPDGSTGLSRGDEMVFRGLNVAGFAEYTVTQANGAIKIPDEVPLELACVIGCAVQTGVGAVLNTAKVVEGATVLVLGLGGIGLSVVQGARLASAAQIIVSDPVPERREAAKLFGATHQLDPGSDDIVEAARDLTDGIGVDYAFETAGFASLVETGYNAARNGGTIIAVGAPPVDQSITLAPATLLTVSGKKLMGCLLGSCNSLLEIPRLVSLWQAGRLDLEALITGRRPLAEINEAMGDLRASRGIRTVLDI
ncbi:MAG: alcohol dehydrogenase catalytic domain-containing protein [Deltaproteobacteria bacterium]|nr:alcohol dehydrogenase catalytic domain-containing protein [Deltaproteobacteria bacterium]MBW2394335.1 alcohol dehydrogenase catalytic domain-containing protein [Deltaproteobacteria bacterium]